jgi:hypothetical protein
MMEHARAMHIAGLLLIADFFVPSPASAFPCDDFNLMRFDPARLEQCIEDMRFMNDVRFNTLETENHILQTQICILALELKEVRPSAYDAVKEACVPAKPKPKKNSPPPTVRDPGAKRP